MLLTQEIESVIKSVPTEEILGPRGFTVEFHRAFQKEFTQILLELFPKNEEEGTLSNSFCESSITLILISKTLLEKYKPINTSSEY